MVASGSWPVAQTDDERMGVEHSPFPVFPFRPCLVCTPPDHSHPSHRPPHPIEDLEGDDSLGSWNVASLGR